MVIRRLSKCQSKMNLWILTHIQSKVTQVLHSGCSLNRWELSPQKKSSLTGLARKLVNRNNPTEVLQNKKIIEQMELIDLIVMASQTGIFLTTLPIVKAVRRSWRLLTKRKRKLTSNRDMWRTKTAILWHHIAVMKVVSRRVNRTRRKLLQIHWIQIN